MKRFYFLFAIAMLLLMPMPANAEKTGVVYHNNKGVNSWWVYPLSVDRGKYTYTSCTTKEGYSGLQEYNRKTGETRRVNLAKLGVDDHNAGAVECLKDGRLIYAVTGHSSKKYLYVFTQKKAGDIENWTKKKLKTKGKATYAQIIKTSKGYYLFTRGRIPASETPEGKHRGYWSVFYSRNGKSWSSEKYVIDTGETQYYLKAMACSDDSSKIRLVMYSNPNKDDTDIRLAFLDANTMAVTDESGKRLGKATNSGDGVPFRKVPVIIKKGSQKLRLLDVAKTDVDTTMVSYALFSDASNAVYKCAVHSSKTGETRVFSLVDSGEAFLSRTYYFGGMVFSAKSTDILYLSRKANDKWRIERWKRGDDGYYFDKLISTSKKNMIRPFVSKNKDILQWSEGYYDSGTFRKADMSINRYIS